MVSETRNKIKSMDKGSPLKEKKISKRKPLKMMLVVGFRLEKKTIELTRCDNILGL